MNITQFDINLRLYILSKKTCIELLLSLRAGGTHTAKKPQSLCVATPLSYKPSLYRPTSSLGIVSLLPRFSCFACYCLCVCPVLFSMPEEPGATTKVPTRPQYQYYKRKTILFIYIDESYLGLEMQSSRIYMRMGTTFTHESKACIYFKDAIARTRSQGPYKKTQARPALSSPVPSLPKPCSLVSKESTLAL